MNDLIKDLDASLTEEGDSTDFAEEYPDAPQQAVEIAQQIEENKRRIKEAAEAIERKKRQRQKRLKRMRADLEATLERTKRQTAALAAQSGIATEEEKQLLKEAAAEEARGENSDLGKYFDPTENGGEN